MLLAGDEIGRRQGGNNNAYCQDNEISWVDWEHADLDLLNFVKKIAALRRENRMFRQQRFAFDEIGWFRNDGKPMTDADCCTGWAKAIGMFLSDSSGDRSASDFYLAFNSYSQPIPFKIPGELGSHWRIVAHTSDHKTRPIAAVHTRRSFASKHTLC